VAVKLAVCVCVHVRACMRACGWVGSVLNFLSSSIMSFTWRNL
jgi:hypothetical protein